MACCGLCGVNSEAISPNCVALHPDLFPEIDISSVQCYNCSNPSLDSKRIFRPYLEKDSDNFALNGFDNQILINVSFKNNVRIKNIIVSGVHNPNHPTSLRLFANANLTMDLIDKTEDQKLNLEEDTKGHKKYLLKQSKFSNVGKLSLVLESTNSDQKISIKYIGLEGVFHSQKQGKMEKFSYRVHGNNPNQAELSSQVVKNIS